MRSCCINFSWFFLSFRRISSFSFSAANASSTIRFSSSSFFFLSASLSLAYVKKIFIYIKLVLIHYYLYNLTHFNKSIRFKIAVSIRRIFCICLLYHQLFSKTKPAALWSIKDNGLQYPNPVFLTKGPEMLYSIFPGQVVSLMLE